MSPFAAELVGTALLLLIGNAVVANVVLARTKGHGSGWIVITFGWGLAVFVAVFTVARYSGAHINPAVTLGLAMIGAFPGADVPAYMLAQLLGAALGAKLVYVVFHDHFAATDDADAKLAVFCTAPAIRNPITNFLSEVIGTFVLVLGVMYMAAPEIGLGALDALPVGLLVAVIGMGLGGTTGFAINPARDLGPRIIHAIVPMGTKRDSDWSYAWVPVMGPFAGAALAAIVFGLLGS